MSESEKNIKLNNLFAALDTACKKTYTSNKNYTYNNTNEHDNAYIYKKKIRINEEILAIILILTKLMDPTDITQIEKLYNILGTDFVYTLLLKSVQNSKKSGIIYIHTYIYVCVYT